MQNKISAFQSYAKSLVEKLSDILYQPSWLSFIFFNLPATRSEKRLRTAQSNHTQGYVVRFWKIYHILLLFNGIFSPSQKKKKLELVEKAKKYHLDIVGVFLPKNVVLEL